ncbi:hypothetical protein SR870_08130 [Rhodopseudomonas palustris]|uniref:hypothetical protein n=1 Tax=Rhodopseudomonas palustris TaxID=1076 RepID=UPI002ACD27A1|nr:hypothetical protein [Rhodopseudomonas palustris]WQH01226.1 hypothetical protein SR870_08130 [Rhodopseudomonas palustris]
MSKLKKTPKPVNDLLLPKTRDSECSKATGIECFEPKNDIEARKSSDLVEVASRLAEFRSNYGILIGGFLYLRTIEVAGKSPTILRAGWIVALASLVVTFWRAKN